MQNGNVKPNAEVIRQLCIERGFTQESLARTARLAKRTIENVQNGKAVQVNTLARIARALGEDVEVRDLLVSSAANRSAPADDEPRFRVRGTAPSLGRPLIGRETDMGEVHLRLRQAVGEEASGVVVVRGVPGVGKSALMHRLAQDDSLGRQFPDGGLWAAVGATPDLAQLLRGWCQTLRVSPDRLTSVNQMVGALRAKLQGRRILLLVDDVWTDAHAECLRVSGPGSAVLYSTRLTDLADRLAPSPSAVYVVHGLELSQGLELLASLAPEVVRDHRAACESLLVDIDGLPLAITVAGRMLQREFAAGGDVGELLSGIRADARVLLSQPVPPDMVDLLNQTTCDVAAVLRRSTASLSPERRWQFARMGAFAPSPATFDLAFAAQCWRLPVSEAKTVARSFIDLGLLEVPRRGQLQIHPLVKALALHEWDLLDE